MSISARNRRSADREQTTETGTVVNFLGVTAPVRPYLTPDEVERLATAARARGRHGHRDATMILFTFQSKKDAAHCAVDEATGGRDG